MEDAVPSISASGCKAGLFLYGLTHPDSDADSDAQSGKLVAFEAPGSDVAAQIRPWRDTRPGPPWPVARMA